MATQLKRSTYLRHLLAEGLIGKTLGVLWSLYGVLSAVKSEFLPASDQEWLQVRAMIERLPAIPFVWWLLGAAAIALIWTFESSFRLQRKATTRIGSLEERTKPLIRIFVDGDGAQAFPTESNGKATGRFAKYVQFSVAPLMDAPLFRCEARLLSVCRIVGGSEGPNLVEEPVWFHWSDHPSAVIDIHAPLWHRANMFHVAEEDKNTLLVDTVPRKVRLPTEIQTHGDYRIKVSVTAIGAPTQNAVLLLHWAGFDDVRLSQES